MSLIHQALEKVEQEKGAKSKPVLPRSFPLESLKPLEKVKDRSENSWTAYGIISVLLLSLILGLVYFFTHPPQPVRLPAHSPKKNRPAPSATYPAPLTVPIRIGRPQFILTGITQVGEERTAIVNNQLVRIGDEIGNAKVEAIEAKKVVLNFDGEKISLSL